MHGIQFSPLTHSAPTIMSNRIVLINDSIESITETIDCFQRISVSASAKKPRVPVEVPMRESLYPKALMVRGRSNSIILQ